MYGNKPVNCEAVEDFQQKTNWINPLFGYHQYLVLDKVALNN